MLIDGFGTLHHDSQKICLGDVRAPDRVQLVETLCLHLEHPMYLRTSLSCAFLDQSAGFWLFAGPRKGFLCWQRLEKIASTSRYIIGKQSCAPTPIHIFVKKPKIRIFFVNRGRIPLKFFSSSIAKVRNCFETKPQNLGWFWVLHGRETLSHTNPAKKACSCAVGSHNTLFTSLLCFL
jgi:hypothetical protein